MTVQLEEGLAELYHWQPIRETFDRAAWDAIVAGIVAKTPANVAMRRRRAAEAATRLRAEVFKILGKLVVEHDPSKYPNTTTHKIETDVLGTDDIRIRAAALAAEMIAISVRLGRPVSIGDIRMVDGVERTVVEIKYA